MCAVCVGDCGVCGSLKCVWVYEVCVCVVAVCVRDCSVCARLQCVCEIAVCVRWLAVSALVGGV